MEIFGGKVECTFKKEDPAAPGVSAEGTHSQHHGAVLPEGLQLTSPLIQQHHSLVQACDQPAPLLLIGDDVLQAHAALRPSLHDGAEPDIAGAHDVRGAEREERPAVQHQALVSPLCQQGFQCAAIHATNLHIDHSSAQVDQSVRLQTRCSALVPGKSGAVAA